MTFGGGACAGGARCTESADGTRTWSASAPCRPCPPWTQGPWPCDPDGAGWVPCYPGSGVGLRRVVGRAPSVGKGGRWRRLLVVQCSCGRGLCASSALCFTQLSVSLLSLVFPYSFLHHLHRINSLSTHYLHKQNGNQRHFLQFQKRIPVWP